MPPKQNLLQMLVFSHIIDKNFRIIFQNPENFWKLQLPQLLCLIKRFPVKTSALDDSKIAINVVAETY